jgi:hypothetical protein
MARKRNRPIAAGVKADRSQPASGPLFARARQIDPAAWAERDRLWAERGVNPDWLGERPRNTVERRMLQRRMHSMRLAVEKDLCAGDPEIATALVGLDGATRH